LLKRDALHGLNPEVYAVNDGPRDFEDKYDGTVYSIPAGYRLKVPRVAFYHWMGYPDAMWETPADVDAEHKRVRLRYGEIDRKQYGMRRPNLRLEEIPFNAPEPVKKPARVQAEEEAFPGLKAEAEAPKAKSPAKKGRRK